MRVNKKDRDEALQKLQAWLRPGDTVYTILRHVARSGMSRSIGVVLLSPREDHVGGLVDLHPNYLVATLLGRSQDKKNDGVIETGAGMDMGFHLVYSLSSALFPQGFECIGEWCPSNDHSNGDRYYMPHWHRDGGYALRHRRL